MLISGGRSYARAFDFHCRACRELHQKSKRAVGWLTLAERLVVYSDEVAIRILLQA
jgi:hypothetical protein